VDSICITFLLVVIAFLAGVFLGWAGQKREGKRKWSFCWICWVEEEDENWKEEGTLCRKMELYQKS
jgi:hypothetical protein